MANEKRLIDANAVLDLFTVQAHSMSYNKMFMTVANAPTVDAVEVVHGRWLSLYEYAEKIGADATKSEYPGAWVFCSKCGQQMRNINGWHYCPNCGAKMDCDGKDSNLLFADMEEIIDATD